MGRMVGRAAGCSAGFLDRHRLFDLAASDFDTSPGCPSETQAVAGLFRPEAGLHRAELASLK